MNKKVYNTFALFFLIFLGISAFFCVYSALTSTRAHVIRGYDKWMKNRKVKVTQPKKKIKSPYGENLPKKPPVVQPKKERYSKHDSKLAQSYGAVTKLMIPDQKKVEQWIVDSFPYRDEFSNFNMAFRYYMGMRKPVEKENYILLPNKKMAGCSYATAFISKTGMGHLLQYKALCEQKNIQFFVVIRPQDTGFYQDDYTPYNGLHLNCNDRLQRRAVQLRRAGIKTLELYRDMRKKIPAEKWLDYFFLTDHHWNVDGALVGSRLIADFMNRNYGTSFDLKYFDPATYIRKRWKDVFVGSIGKKFTTSYIRGGKEDLDVLYPNYHTSFTIEFPAASFVRSGDFSVLTFPERISFNAYHSWSYNVFLKGSAAVVKIKNNKIKNGKKILMIRDSFAQPMIPYLALQTKEIVALDPRILSHNTILKMIKTEEPDILCIMFRAGI